MSQESSFDQRVQRSIANSVEAKQRLLQDHPLISLIGLVSQVCLRALRSGNKLLLFGNGGSAADTQHIATEIVGRFAFERPALPALALSVDTSALTTVSNDYGFDHAFSRQIEALGREGDVALGFSTTGNSPNVLRASRLQKKEIIHGRLHRGVWRQTQAFARCRLLRLCTFGRDRSHPGVPHAYRPHYL